MTIRDISPRNMLVNQAGDVKFIDFEQVSEIGINYNSRYSGTPRYAAVSEVC